MTEKHENSNPAEPDPLQDRLKEMGVAEETALPSPEEEERYRMRVCFDGLKALLAEHRCYLAPGWDNPIPVGTEGTTFQVSANWSLRALPEPARSTVQVRE